MTIEPKNQYEYFSVLSFATIKKDRMGKIKSMNNFTPYYNLYGRVRYDGTINALRDVRVIGDSRSYYHLGSDKN